MNETPRANRVHIAFFGLRNAGKSTLINRLTGQDVAIVSDVPGTTTDPVSKAMEIAPLGPCLITDTAGLDDEGDLGRQRVEKTLRVLETTDVAVWVASEGDDDARRRLAEACAARRTVLLDYRRGDSVEKLKDRLAAVKVSDEPPPLLAGLVRRGDSVLCVCPIDGSAPKGRLILPQVQTIREALDAGASAYVCQPDGLAAALERFASADPGSLLVVTDSQAFREVSRVLGEYAARTGRRPRFTSFSVLFARQKGDLCAYCAGAAALETLKDGDTVLVSEGCTHHRQCNDIGTVKLPRWIEGHVGRKLNFAFTQGGAFPERFEDPKPALVVHCGGCMLTRREVRRRIALAQAADVPITNYGICIGRCHGIEVDGESGLIAAGR